MLGFIPPSSFATDGVGRPVDIAILRLRDIVRASDHRVSGLRCFEACLPYVLMICCTDSDAEASKGLSSSILGTTAMRETLVTPGDLYSSFPLALDGGSSVFPG